jgi:hypothetical protein
VCDIGADVVKTGKGGKLNYKNNKSIQFIFSGEAISPRFSALLRFVVLAGVWNVGE